MAKPKTYPRLTREAADPTTAPARLDYLSRHSDPTVRRLALANPALPGARLTEALRLGYPPAWGNPAALWALLEMPPADAQEGAVRAVTELARCRTRTAAVEPPHAVTETMASLLRPHLLAAWEDYFAGYMLEQFARYAQACGPLSPQHRASTLLMCLAQQVLSAGFPEPSEGEWGIDEVEKFTWSEAADGVWRKAMFDRSIGRDLFGYAATCDPECAHNLSFHLQMRSNMGRVLLADLANLLRAAMPVPMWLDELTPPQPVAP